MYDSSFLGKADSMPLLEDIVFSIECTNCVSLSHVARGAHFLLSVDIDLDIRLSRLVHNLVWNQLGISLNLLVFEAAGSNRSVTPESYSMH